MPADYVNKLARMFQDIKVSEDLNGEFKEAHRNNNEGLAGQLSSTDFFFINTLAYDAFNLFNVQLHFTDL